jgi:hypothetical protein
MTAYERRIATADVPFCRRCGAAGSSCVIHLNTALSSNSREGHHFQIQTVTLVLLCAA